MRVRILRKESEKQKLINHLSSEKYTLMFFYEEAPGDNVPHECMCENITLVHPPYDYEALEKWLYLGNWQAISPANKDYQPFNTFKATEPEIEKRMTEAKLNIIIDSFHDDIEWNVIE